MYLGALAVFNTEIENEIRRCEAAGGYAVVGYGAYDANRAPIPASAYVRGCQMPPAAPSQPSAPVTVTVPTTVQTQVSPQVSPVFTQQDQPQSSPVTAASSQQVVPVPSAIPEDQYTAVVSPQDAKPANAAPPVSLQSMALMATIAIGFLALTKRK